MNLSTAARACALTLTSLLLVPSLVFGEAAPAQSGFLSDYTRLQKAGMPTNRYLVYRDAELASYAGKSVYLSPIVVFPATATFENIDAATVQGTLQAFDASLRERLAPRAKLVDTRAAADLVVEVALTQVTSEEKGKKVVDVIPARAVMNVAKEVALGESLVAATSLEARLTDARSGKLLAELMQHSPGKGIGRSGSEKTHVTLEALKPAVDDSAKLIAEQLVP